MNPQLQIKLQQAIEAFQKGNFDRADSILNSVLNVDTQNLPALHILGLIKASQAKYKEAADLLSRAARIDPNEGSIQYNLAKALADCGSESESLPHHKKAVELVPTNPEAWLNYGKTLLNLGFYDDALTICDKAISLKPDYAAAFINKGAAYKELSRYEEAITFAERALSINPNLAEAWNNKGIALKELKRSEEAIKSFDRAVGLKPDFAEAWVNKGNALHELRCYEDALTHYDKALSIKSEYVDALSNKAVTLSELKRYDEAITQYENALHLKPSFDWALGNCLHIKMKICNWFEFGKNLLSLETNIRSGKKATSPFAALSLIDDPLLHKQCAEIYARSKYPFNASLGPIAMRIKQEKIRIGYFSSDFRDHPVSYLTAELFELHDKSRFEIVAFSSGPDDKSPMRLRLNKAFTEFIDVSAMSDRRVAELARELCIDIAIDLGGFTAQSRPGIFAYRAAPIQVSYIGYLGTMAAEYIDYLIADATIIPADSRPFYTEKIAYIPSYQANDSQKKISERTFTREELGLPDKGFVFACFNNNYKILPATFDSWMRILKASEGSVLFLYADNEKTQDNLRKEAEVRGISSQRLVFGKSLPGEDYLARYKSCDLFLDTAPYNAGTTASDALWVGLPVLTLTGKSFASRMAASLLNAIGLSELITISQEAYEAKAIEFARSPEMLTDIKEKLMKNRTSSPLFDTPLFINHLEVIYTQMMNRYLADLPPDHLHA